MPNDASSPARDASDHRGPLDGVTVLDCSQMLAGPLCSMRLGDLGADVIKVEPPGRGEWSRTRYLRNVQSNGHSTSFLALNRNKRSVALDLKTAADRDTFYQLASNADVFLHNFRVGTVERLGISYEDLKPLNPQLIYCSISGYGETGPYAQRAGQDLVIQGYSGSLWAVGRASDPPIPNSLWAADVMSGYQAVIGILSAVIARRWLGEGQKVEVSMLATVMECEIQELTTHLVSGQLPTRSAEPSAHGWIGAPYGIYETADGHIVLAYVPLGELAEVIGCSELLKYSSIDDGFTHRDEMSRLVAEALRKRPTSEWLDEMLPRGFMAGPVYTYADLVNDPHVSATGMIAEVENPGGGTYRTPSPPIRLSKTPLRISRRPPKLGEHTTEVVASIATAPPEKLSSAGDSSNS